MAELNIEIVCGTGERQTLLKCLVQQGTTVGDAIDSTALQQDFPEIDLAAAAVGIFGRKVERGRVVKEGDRIEIYRPLILDPREARRQRARRGAGQ